MSEKHRERIMHTAMMQLRAEASKYAAALEMCFENPGASSVDHVVSITKQLANCDVAMRIIQATADNNPNAVKLGSKGAKPSPNMPNPKRAEEFVEKQRKKNKKAQAKDPYSETPKAVT